MNSFDGFEAFVAAVDAGSIAAAARVLGVPRPTLSRQLNRLENSLQVRLVHRTNRQLVLTAAGESFYARARRVVEDAHEARRAAQNEDGIPRGLLRVAGPPGLQGTIGELLLQFMEDHPQVRVELVSDSRYVDLVAEGFDLAIRGGDIRSPDLIIRKLIDVQRRVVASIAYLEEHGVPTRADQLSEHRAIRLFTQGTTPETHWPLLKGGHVAIDGSFTCNSLPMVARAVQRGMGLAFLPFIPSGTVPVLEDVVGNQGRLALVYPDRHLTPPAARALIDFLVQHVEQIRAGHKL